jgi:hypothetical protein
MKQRHRRHSMLGTLIIVFSSLAISLVAGCGPVKGPGNGSTDSKISEDELAIFSIVLKDLPSNRSTIGGSPHEVLGVNIENVKEVFPEINSDTFEDFARRNSSPVVIEGEYLVRPGYALVPRQSIDSDKTQRHYVFSRIGFSRDRKQAFVYMLDACDPLCSRGAFYLLVARDGNWQVVREEVAILT